VLGGGRGPARQQSGLGEESAPLTCRVDRAATAQVLDNALSTLHVPYSYGFAIILLTIIVKALTFPLSRKQARAPLAAGPLPAGPPLRAARRGSRAQGKAAPARLQCRAAS